jgi:hypothetical protein
VHVLSCSDGGEEWCTGSAGAAALFAWHFSAHPYGEQNIASAQANIAATDQQSLALMIDSIAAAGAAMIV